MATMINWNEIITTRIIPTGFHNLEIEKAELVSNYRGCKQINLKLRVVAPEVAKGKTHMEFLELGQIGKQIDESKGSSDWRERMAIDDPDFQDPRIIQNSRELKKFKRMLEAGGFRFPGQASLEEIVAAAPGHVFTGHVTTAIQEFGKNAGEEINVLGNIFALGVETPRIETETETAPSTNGRTRVQKPAPQVGSAVRPRPSIPSVSSDDEIPY